MEFLAKLSHNRALELSNDAADSKGRREQVRMAAAPLHDMHYFIGPQYPLEEKDSMEIRSLRPREANVELTATAMKSKEIYTKQ